MAETRAAAVPLLAVLWLVFMASTAFWVPAYQGDVGFEIEAAAIAAAVYAVVAALAAIGLRGRAATRRRALVSALPAGAVLAGAAAVGLLVNWRQADVRGAPIFLFFAVALWASWAVLVLATAVLARTRWNGLLGIGLTLVVALLGLPQFSARID